MLQKQWADLFSFVTIETRRHSGTRTRRFVRSGNVTRDIDTVRISFRYRPPTERTWDGEGNAFTNSMTNRVRTGRVDPSTSLPFVHRTIVKTVWQTSRVYLGANSHKSHENEGGGRMKRIVPIDLVVLNNSASRRRRVRQLKTVVRWLGSSLLASRLLN